MLSTPEFSRKTLMLGAGMGFLALATGCARTGSEAQPAPSASSAASTAAAAPEWEYTGAMGPQEWGTLSPSYTSCQAGTAQSPIDLTGGALNGTASGTGDQGSVIQLQYQPSDAEVVNNGHTSELHSAAPQVMLLNGQPWTFKQFHYHAPSEHTLDGKRFEAEFHFVHQSDDGRLSVLGVLAVEGPNNGAWAAFVDAAAAAPAAGSKATAGVVDLGALIPASLDHFAYTGSLTTPPCSENVQWLVLETPVELGRTQLDALTSVHDGNDRPIQSLNGRAVSVVHQ